MRSIKQRVISNNHGFYRTPTNVIVCQPATSRPLTGGFGAALVQPEFTLRLTVAQQVGECALRCGPCLEADARQLGGGNPAL